MCLGYDPQLPWTRWQVLALGRGWRRHGAGDEALAQLRQLQLRLFSGPRPDAVWPCSAATRPRAINLAVAHRVNVLPLGDLGGSPSSQVSGCVLMHGLGGQRAHCAGCRGLSTARLRVLLMARHPAVMIAVRELTRWPAAPGAETSGSDCGCSRGGAGAEARGRGRAGESVRADGRYSSWPDRADGGRTTPAGGLEAALRTGPQGSSDSSLRLLQCSWPQVPLRTARPQLAAVVSLTFRQPCSGGPGAGSLKVPVLMVGGSLDLVTRR